MSFRGAALCCVCKKFCTRSKTVCSGCGGHCHTKCRQSLCCHPCNKCWDKVLTKRSCVCGKSLRSLGIFIERSSMASSTTSENISTPPFTSSVNASTPSLPIKRNSDRVSRTSASRARQRIHLDKENENVVPMEVFPHEQSSDYLLRVRERGGNDSLEKWEDCRILTKSKVEKSNGRHEVLCTIECRLRTDLNETKPWRPEQSIRYYYPS